MALRSQHPGRGAAPRAGGASAAAHLEGLTLDDGWRVQHKLPRPEGATGGAFSVGYVAKRGDQQGFLKALNYGRALEAANPAEVLEHLTRAFNFEKDILNECKKRNLRRVVAPLSDGVIRAKGSSIPVQYIIFELADEDVRRQAILAGQTDIAWSLTVLHQVAVGLSQLHSIRVAHQDLKPSNVLLFGEDQTKLGDLGCASRQGTESPRDALDIPGDHTYAPIELLYGHVSDDWGRRRLTTDLYQLGNLGFFLLQGISLTADLLHRVAPVHHYAKWKAPYSEVSAYIEHAHAECLAGLRAWLTNDASPLTYSHRDELVQLLGALTDPDPSRRGHPTTVARYHHRHGLQRVVSAFNRLATRAGFGLRRPHENL